MHVCVCMSACAGQLYMPLHLPQISQEETQTFPLSSVVTLSARNIKAAKAEGTPSTSTAAVFIHHTPLH